MSLAAANMGISRTMVKLAAACCILLGSGAVPAAGPLETAAAVREGAGGVFVADGAVEAVRQSVIAAQVAGRITALTARAGQSVRAGEVLVRIDERAAVQEATASAAQVAAARAQLDAARKELERSERLFSKQYISQAAMDQAEAQFKAAEAQARATLAQAGAASTETSLRTLVAPYGGVVASVSAEVGDMATPGKPLMILYDPLALRVVVHLPESAATDLKPGAPVRIEFPGASGTARWRDAQSVTLLPTADPASHTIEVRLTLPQDLRGVPPGMFAKAHLPLAAQGGGAILVPAKAVFRRSELFAVYVVDSHGQPQLRQVRPGPVRGDRIEILAGVDEGERVVLDPLAAAAFWQ